MSDVLMAVEINCATGEVIERPFTQEEVAAHAVMIAQGEKELADRKARAEAKADAKLAAQAKLAALGLTGEEVAAITE